MARQLSLPQHFKLAQAINPRTTNGGVTSDIVSVKTGQKLWFVVELTQAAAHATTLSLVQATSVAGSTNKAGPAVPIWANEDTVASDTLVRQASDAASYAVTANVKNKEIVFEVDPARLDLDNGYDCVYLTASDSSQATNFISAVAIVDTNYKQATPPSVIVD